MPTVAQIETRARIRADQDQSTFPTSAQYLELISDAAEELWNRMVAAGCKPAQTALQITATGASSYNLATNVLSVLSVERHEGVDRLPLVRVQEEDLPALRSLTTNYQATHYDLVGGAVATLTIELLPTPSSGLYTVRYIPRFTRYTLTTENWFGPPRSDEYIVVATAIKALRKEGDEARDLVQELNAIFEDVVRMASWQDAQGTGRVRDIHRPGSRYRPFDDWRARDEDT